MLRLRHALVEIIAAARSTCSARASAELPTTSAFAAPSQQDQVTAHHFSHIFFLAAGLVVPGAGLQAAFDVNFPTLLQIFSRDFREPLPEHHVVPLGAV